MIMTIVADDKLNPELWWILQEIRKNYQATPKEELVEFWIKTDDALPPDRQKKLLQKLEKDYGVIKIREPFSRKLLPNTRPVLFGIEEIKGFFLEILQPKFDKFYEKYKQKQKEESMPQGEVKFDDDKAVLKLGERECPLPPYKNEHFLCRAMFKYPIKEPVDWSLIYKEITGIGEPRNTQKDKRMVYDAVEAVNTRVKEIFGIDTLFLWADKTIKRM